MKFTGERYIPGDPECEEIRFEHESRYHFASEFVKDKVVADMGCGAGYGCKILLEFGAKSVYGLDISLETLKYARSEFSAEGLMHIWSPVESLPFSDNNFDLVTSFEVVEHLKDYKGHLLEIKRILKDDGLLIISTPNVSVQIHTRKNMERNFHVHEFCFHDFKKFIQEYFPNVEFYSQRYNHSIVIEPYNEKRENISIENQNRFLDDTPSDFDGDYVIALCSKKDISSFNFESKSRIYNISHTSRIHEVRRHIIELDEEIKELRKLSDERGKWASELDAELKDKAETIQNLREELEKSNTWAIRVSDELKELREKEQQAGLLRKFLKKFI